jgi:NADH:ubiquinone oxidoreductase subunit 5 (subunit L)/multisubunit Na+/H+ antiporter MnhA subunit
LRRCSAPSSPACSAASSRAGSRTYATILGVAVALVASYVIFQDVQAGNTFNGALYTWATSGFGDCKLTMEIGFLIDKLTVMMMLVVTFVSLMVHIYTIGYMAEDPGYNRFFSYISLFTFSMLMLVMSNNFVQLFFGWEAVGLVSYLLIGFWYTRPTAIFANMKAFLVNRVGDFGFILGIGLICALRRDAELRRSVRKGARVGRCAMTWPFGRLAVDDRRPASACSSARWASRRRFRCTSGCRIRWKARRRSPR